MFKDHTFSLSRFLLLCRKNLVENWKTNLLRIALMYGVMVVMFIWIGYFQYKPILPEDFDPMVEIALNIFIWFGMICGCISASFTMENMKNKTSRISALMTPATSFEKYISRWLMSTVVYLLVFMFVFKLADYTRVLIFSMAYPEKHVLVAQFNYLFSTGDYAFIQHETLEVIKKIFLFGSVSYFFIQSCFVLGSSIWPKNSLIKMFVAGFVVIALLGTIIGVVGHFMFSNSRLRHPENFEDIMENLALIWGIALTLLNWILAYFRFKESEIINRW